MGLWDDLPADLRDSGAVDGLRPLLESVTTPASAERAEADGTWRIFTTSLGGGQPLSVNPATGTFARGGSASPSSSTIEFPDPSVGIELGLRLEAPGGSPDGTVRLIVSTPSAVLRLPFLRGARLDAQGQLRADALKPVVRFVLPALRVRVLRPSDGAIDVTLLSAHAGGTPVDHIYDFVRMDPPHALVGPGDVVGFAFRSAVLDLSGTAGPGGVPAEARAMPGDWQGLFLPEARLFVAPSGLEGLAVSGGVRNLWIGFGRHEGVTGLFEAEVVQRGAAPRVRLRFQTPTGEWIGVPDIDSTTPIGLPESARVYVDAGGGLAPFTLQLTVGGTTTSSDRADVTVPATGTLTIGAEVSDAGGHTSTRSVIVERRPAGPGGSPGAAPDAGVSLVPTSPPASHVELVAQTTTHATVRLEPPGGDIVWTWAGGTHTGATAEVPVAAGATVSVTAVRTRAAVAPIDAYMLFDRPRESEKLADFAKTGTYTRTQPASSRTGWGSAPELQGDALDARIAALPPGTTWTVEGWASYEGDDSQGQRDRNLGLSTRRRDVLVEILRSKGLSVNPTGTAHGHVAARDGVSPDGGSAPAPGSTSWWRARATASPVGPTAETITADLVRQPITALEDVDPAPTRPPVPDCFRKIGVRVELLRSTFVRAEIYGEIDIHTTVERRLAASSAIGPLPPRDNPQDGISTFLVRLRVAEDRSSWDVTAEFRAVEGDLDGLAKVERPATGDASALNVLGAISALGPVLAAATPPSPREGELVPLVVLTSAAIGLGVAGVIQTRYVILRGGEVVITDGPVDPAEAAGPRTTQVSVLLDVETAFTFDLGFIRVNPDKPIVTRYKAVGVRATWDTRTRSDGSIEYVPLPVFDPSRGYKLDVPTGSLAAAPPLDNLLRILGVSVSRDNPTYLEVEVGLGVDLGIVTVDSVRARLRLDQVEPPQLTKLAASLTVPGTLHGSGYVEITPGGFKGAFDLTVVPLNVRASAALAVETFGGVTGVLIGAEVQFPVPIPLGNSGLGIYGFLGGVGVNYGRLEPTGVQAPALRWLEAQLAPSRNNVMHPAGWEHRAGSYAFAAGLLLGTAEGGFVVHLKGIVLIEVPGPRLLLAMKADVLKLPPVLKSQSNASFLAVLDLDFGRGTITIGVVAEYSVVSLLRIRVPVTAFFNTKHVEQWFVDLGTFNEPVTVSVIDVFSGTGYLMVHGNGIAHPRLPTVSSGLTIAVGFHLQAVLMGSKAIGLYFEASAGFDALVSFEPFSIGGRIYARGELRLFIVGIGASAELTVVVGRQRITSGPGAGTEVERTYIHGEVCGEVDLFFFSVKECVSLTLGETPPDEPVAPPLVAGVTLVSRSPALLEGTATDRAVDGALANAVPVGDGAPLPSVPLDAIPVVLFESPPLVAAGNVVLGGTARGSSGLPADPWIRRGDRWWRYRITRVELAGSLQPAPPAGKTPATWWARGMPGDPQHGPALALLSWLPTPTPRAVPYGEQLERTVHQRWGRVCGPAADAAPVFWTFDGQPVGPSAPGWRLSGVSWPDAPGTYRSSPVDGRMLVGERWRTGDTLADLLQGTEPARVVGDAVPCRPRTARPSGFDAWMRGQPLTFSRAALPLDGGGMQQVANLIADGTSLGDVGARWAATTWDPLLSRVPLECHGRVLRSPVGDIPEPAPDADDDDRRSVEETWHAREFKPSELGDSVTLRVEGGLGSLLVLLLVPRKFVERGLVLAFRDADGAHLGHQPSTGADIVSTSRPLPGRWLDVAGPWVDPMDRAGRLAGRVMATERTLLPVLVAADLPSGTVEVEIGWDRRIVQDAAAAFWVVAMEGLVATEARRREWDITTLEEERSVLETAVTQDPDDHALLVPSQTYTVRVGWQAESLKQEAKPPANAPDKYGAEEVQEFRFTADRPSEAPRDLAPWLLATAPAMNDVGIFCREPVRIALSTQKVAALFDAYGEELRVFVRAASGKHPEPPGGGAPGAPVTIPASIGGLVKEAPAALTVMTPWQEAVTAVLDALPCTDGRGSRTHATVVELPYTFEPLTEYLIDVAAVPTGAPSNVAGRRVHRVGFTTSRFDTVDDLARLIRLGALDHRLVPVPAALEALPAVPTGDQLDVAFQAAGLGVPQVPRYPRVQVLWSPDPVPAPVAVVVECSEPMWRDRPMPAVVTGPADASDPAHKWWAAVNTAWLRLAPHGTLAESDPPAPPVARVVRGPGGTRAVVLLAPGSRGAEVRLNLVVTADALAGTAATTAEAVRVALVRAPWEVED
jgi:large repetitive protein